MKFVVSVSVALLERSFAQNFGIEFVECASGTFSLTFSSTFSLTFSLTFCLTFS